MRYKIDYTTSFISQRIQTETREDPGRRQPFQRDRDRVMHSRAFRRMMHKTQLFDPGISEHFRNRLTHTLEVSQIARSIGKALDLDEDLVEAIALGHDLGHTPFGHVGERTLNRIMRGEWAIIPDQEDGFKHNLQTLRVVDELEVRCTDYNGINLTLAVREGFIKHTEIKKNGMLVQHSKNNYDGMDLEQPFSYTFEGQVVAVADEIAQRAQDLEDSMRIGIIKIDDIKNYSLIKSILEDRNIDRRETEINNIPHFYIWDEIIHDYISLMINSAIETSLPLVQNYCDCYHPDFSAMDNCVREQCVMLDPEMWQQIEEIKKMVREKVQMSEMISIADAKAEFFIRQLFKAFYSHPKQMPDYDLIWYARYKGIEFSRTSMDDVELRKDPDFIRVICDHIAGMTDMYAKECYEKLYLP